VSLTPGTGFFGTFTAVHGNEQESGLRRKNTGFCRVFRCFLGMACFVS
jgi:hypothetical protein